MIAYSVSGRIATVKFNDPKQLNSLFVETYTQFTEAMHTANRDPNVFLTLITGEGRFFSAGANFNPANETDQTLIQRVGESEYDYFHRRFAATIKIMSNSIIEHDKVTVVALNGPVIGYSAAFISHADIIYASENATLHALFSQLGLSPEGGSSYAFVQRMGLSKALEALLFSKKFTSNELLDCGFVNKVFPNEGFQGHVLKEINLNLYKLTPNSVLATKKLIRSYTRDQELKNIDDEISVLVKRFESGEPQKLWKELGEKVGRNKSKL